MAPIIAPGVARFTVNGLYGGQSVANIIDMFIETTGSIVSRGEALEAQAGIIINEWSDHILPNCVVDYTAVSVSWVDLDSLTGTTGERQSTDQETWPQAGTGSGSPMPGNVAWRVDKNTIATRGQRQGRLYIPGVSEGWTGNAGPNLLQQNVVDITNTDLASFLGNINQSDDGSDEYTSVMVVVHTSGGAYESRSDVSSLTTNARVGSQSRRLR